MFVFANTGSPGNQYNRQRRTGMGPNQPLPQIHHQTASMMSSSAQEALSNGINTLCNDNNNNNNNNSSLARRLADIEAPCEYCDYDTAPFIREEECVDTSYDQIDNKVNNKINISACVCGGDNILLCACKQSEKLKKIFSVQRIAKKIRSKKMHLQEGISPELINKVFNFSAMFYAVARAPDAKQAAAILYLYINTLNLDANDTYNKVVTVLGGLDVTGDLSNVFDDMKFQALDDEAQKESVFHRVFKSFKQHWTNVLQSPFLGKLRRAFALIVALLFCKENDLAFSMGRFKWFSMELPKGGSFLDLVDALLDLVGFVVDRMSSCFAVSSIAPLFARDSMALELLVPQLRAGILNVESGNYEGTDFLDESDFVTKLVRTIAELKEVSTRERNALARAHLLSLYYDLLRVKTRFDNMVKNGSLRVAPYAVLVFGNSGLGKSSVANIVMKQILAGNGFKSKAENVVTLNVDEKFHSGYAAQHAGVIFDDIANAKKGNTGGGNHCAAIIDFINNVPKAALSAVAESKGNLMIRPKAIVGTTNIKGLDAHEYSNEPVSILRRFNMIISVTVKPDYCIPGTTMLDSSKVPQDTQTPDVWTFKVEYVIGRTGYTEHQEVEFVNIGHDLSISDLCDLIRTRSAEHFAHQEMVVGNSSQIYDLDMCPHKLFPSLCSNCFDLPHLERESEIDSDFDSDEKASDTDSTDSLSEHLRFEQAKEDFPPKPVLTRARRVVPTRPYESKATIAELPPPTSKKLTRYERFSEYLSTRSDAIAYDWAMRLPESIRIPLIFLVGGSTGYPMVDMLLSGSHELLVRYSAIAFCWFLVTMWSFFLPLNIWVPVLLSNFLVIPFYLSALLVKYRPVTFFRNLYEKRRKYTFLAISVTSLVVVIGTIRSFRRMVPSLHQGVTEGEIRPVKEVPDHDVWRRSVPRTEIPASHVSETTTFGDLVGKVYKKIANVTICDGDGLNGKTAHILPIACGVWMMNAHVAKHLRAEDSRILKVTRWEEGSNFSVTIGRDSFVMYPELDLAFIHLPSGGTLWDIRPFFTDEPVPSSYFSYFPSGGLMPCFKDGEKKIIQCGRVVLGQSTVMGSRVNQVYNYNTPKAFDGLCGSPLIMDKKSPQIFGIHYAGNSNSGSAVPVTRRVIDEAFGKIFQDGTVLQSHSEGTLKMHLGTVDFGPAKENHEKSVTTWLTEDSNIVNYGAHSSVRRSFNSNVGTSCISDDVASVMGLPKKHGPPRGMNNMRHWQVHAEKIAHCPSHFVPEGFDAAVKDLTHVYEHFAETHPESMAQIKPLNIMNVINGADGVRGLDAIPKSTSAGWPFNTSKTAYMVKVDEEVTGITDPWEYTEEIMEGVREMEQTLLKGERSYSIFRANLKDEAIALTKDKVRVFAGAQLRLSVLVRKYFLPIIMVMQQFPFVFECAVGVNAICNDWTLLMKFVRKYGDQRGIAGDYKSYDTRCPAQFTQAAFALLIRLAKLSGNYTADDITIMRGLATEICYPVYEHNGDLLMAIGSNPSGHNLTVFINNICNSLFMRYAFKVLRPESGTFAESVALLCYGDDNIMSVAEGDDRFNHTSISRVLAASGIQYTMADKISESKPFIPLDTANFLKRAAVWDEDLNGYLAPLEEDSISKTLHCKQKKCVLNENQQAVESMTNALSEYLLFGETMYELRRSQFQQIAAANDLSHLCGETFEYDFSTAMGLFKEKYHVASSFSPETSELFVV